MEDQIIHILLIEKEPAEIRRIRDLLVDGKGQFASPDRFALAHVPTLPEVQSALAHQRADLILLSINKQAGDSLDALEHLQKVAPATPVVVLNGREAELPALRRGAADFLDKQHLDHYNLARAILHVIERGRIQNQLNESELRFHRLVDNAQDLIYRYRLIPPVGFEYVSPSATAITGYTPEEHYADPELGLKLVHPEDRPLLDAATRGEIPLDQPLTLRWLKKDGSIIWTEQRNVLVLDSSGNPLAIEGIARDITERKRAEEALRESEERYRDIFNGVQDAIFVETFDGTILAVNDRACEMYGYSREAFLTKTVADLVPAGQPILMSNREEISAQPLETVNLRSNGERFPIEISSKVQTIHGEEVLLIIVRDITERKRSEEALEQSEENYRKLIDGMNETVWVIDFDGNLIDVNKTAVDVLGYSKEELLVAGLYGIDASLRKEEILALVNAMPVDKIQIFETLHTTKDGRTFPVEVYSSLVTYQGKRAILSIARDITERKQAEGKLNDSRQFFHNTLDSLSAHIAILDETGAIIAVNDSWRRFGQANGLRLKGDGVGSNYLNICKISRGEDEKIALAIADTIEGMLSGREADALQIFEYPCHSPQEKRWFIARLSKFEQDGKTRIVVSHENITGRKQAEGKIRQQLDRMSALRSIDRAISGSMDMRVSLEILLGEVLSQLGVDAASILLLSKTDPNLEYFAGKGFRTQAIRETRIRLGDGFAGQVGLERRVLHVPDLAEVKEQFKRARLLKEENFVAYFGVPLIAKGMLKGVLEIFQRAPLESDGEWVNYLETLGGQAAIAIDNAQMFDGVQRSNLELFTAYDATIEGWSRAMDLRDRETAGHTQRVTQLSVELAGKMGLERQELLHLRRGALLHDIGKLGVPDHVLLKPGKLTEEEWALMRQHPVFAFEMLRPIQYLQPALDIPYCHHEKWDGSGYPRGLAGEQIPLAARIFAIVDVYDALTTDRPYREAWSKEAA
ncbi:MAG: PAS domain S-box protein, partial [Chloroflexota bacterium]